MPISSRHQAMHRPVGGPAIGTIVVAVIAALSTPGFASAEPPPGDASGYQTITGTVSFDKGTKLKKKDFADAVVWLEGKDLPPELVPSMVAEMPPAVNLQEDMRFEPRVLPVVLGQEVQFPNGDTVFHSVISMSDVKKFDLGIYGPGDTKSAVFEGLGVVELRCAVHSEMQGFVVVVDTPFFAKPDRNGVFTIEGAPAGKYTLHVWHPGIEAIEKPVVVKADKENTVGAITLRPAGD